MFLQYWELGLFATVFASFLSTLGVQLRITALNRKGRSAQICTLGGWSVWLLGCFVGQIALSMTPATILACLSFGSCLFFNALLAPLVLCERLSNLHILGIILLCVGCCISTLCSSHQNDHYRWREILAFAGRPAFLIVSVCVACMAVCVIVRAGYQYYPRQKTRQSIHTRKTDDSSFNTPLFLDAWGFAYLYAMVASVDFTVTKCTLEIVRLRVSMAIGDDDSHLPSSAIPEFTALMLCCHLVAFCFQIQSVKYGDALQNVPLFFSTGAMMQVALGGTFFNEFAEFTVGNTAGFLTGGVLMLGGVVVTSHAVAPAEECPDSQVTPSDSGIGMSLCDLATHLEPEVPADLPVITGGLFSRRLSGSMKYRDFLLVGDLQRTAMCFSAKVRAPHSRFRRNASCPGAIPSPIASAARSPPDCLTDFFLPSASPLRSVATEPLLWRASSEDDLLSPTTDIRITRAK